MVKNNKKIIAIIPARGGSKRLPRKNVRMLSGKPLIAHTIEPALKSRYLNRVIVSTEDKEIAEISQKYGAEVIKRPEELAVDTSAVADAVFHVLDTLKKEGYFPEIIVLLQPTSPLRTSEDIDKALELFFKQKPLFLQSVSKAHPPLYWHLKMEGKYIKPIFGWKFYKMREQDLPKKTFLPNGAIYILTPEVLLKYRDFSGPKMIPYIMPEDRSVDVDTEFDLKLAELIKRETI